MGNAYSIPKIHFEELQTQIMKGGDYLLINTLPLDMQQCLICSTVVAQDEETIMNTMIKEKKWTIRIILYGMNYNDPLVIKKYNQMTQLGMKNVCIYIGGLFEWLCLQEIYGDSLFMTTKKDIDLLKYK
tara:strand:- start:273 stop:659 length:387 start_codon:yes stop_codon:yes gene_type:complete